MARLSGGWRTNELRAEPRRNLSKSRNLRRTYFKRCSAERSAHSATYGVQFGYQFGDGAVLGHPHSADTNRPRRRGDRMKRRDLLTGALGFTCTAVIGPTQAETVRRKRLGYLSGGKQGIGGAYTSDILKASLRDLGWRENETIDIDERWADGDVSRLPRLARELVALRSDVIAVAGGSETKALQAVTQDIPIVFHMVADPVANGVVASISRPGGNITGLAQGPQILWSKRLGLLTEMLGGQPRHLAWLGNPGNSGSELNWADAKDATTRA